MKAKTEEEKGRITEQFLDKQEDEDPQEIHTWTDGSTTEGTSAGVEVQPS